MQWIEGNQVTTHCVTVDCDCLEIRALHNHLCDGLATIFGEVLLESSVLGLLGLVRVKVRILGNTDTINHCKPGHRDFLRLLWVEPVNQDEDYCFQASKGVHRSLPRQTILRVEVEVSILDTALRWIVNDVKVRHFVGGLCVAIARDVNIMKVTIIDLLS